MTIEEIFQLEKRDEDNIYEIHFYLEGIFWTAYEWSAYLSRIFPSDLKDNDRLKPIRKVTKTNQEGYIQVGLQLSSFEKYFPSVINNDEIFIIDDKHITINAKSFFINQEFHNYEKILNEWKSTVQPKISKKTIKTNKDDLNTLIDKIINYPIEKNNLIENLQFLSHIKSELIRLRKSDK